MKIKLIISLIALIAFLFLLPEPIEEKEIDAKSDYLVDSHFIIRNVRLYTGEKLLESTDILIKNNMVIKIAENIDVSSELERSSITELDGNGKTLLPGLIDSHTHAYNNALSDALNFGVTTELDMFTMPAFANQHQSKRENINNTKEADLFSATILTTAKGGHGTEYGLDIPVLESVEQVESFVADRVQQGADYIKAVYNAKEAKLQHYPSISYEILQSLITHSHFHKKILVVHVDNLISARHALELGADGIVHSFMDEVVDDEFVGLMLKNNAFMIPTLTVNASFTRSPINNKMKRSTSIKPYLNTIQSQQLNASFPDFGIPHSALEIAFKSVKKLSDRGVTILAGSDAPNPGTTHGVSMHDELYLLVKAGLTNLQAIRAATSAAGKHFPIDDRGTIKEGSIASMILIDGNPIENIEQSSKIAGIWKNGIAFKRIPKSKELSNPIQKPMDITNSFVVTKDDVAGGASGAKFENVLKASNKPYLYVSGNLNKGFMYPWAGIAYLPGQSMNQALDFSKISTLSFEAKSSSTFKNLTIMVFQQGSFQPLEQTIVLTEKWKGYSLNMTDFGLSGLNNIVNISIVNNSTFGSFNYSIRDIELNQ